MTTQQLHALALDFDTKIDAVINAANSSKEILRQVREATAPPSVVGKVLDKSVDQATQLPAVDFVAVGFLPDWLSALKSVEVAADALNTDSLSETIPPAVPPLTI